MSPNDEDLEGYWDDLRPKPLIQVVDDRPSELGAVLEVVCEKTIHDVQHSLEMYLRDLTEQNHRAADQVVARGIRALKVAWLKEFEGKNLTGLVEFILQGTNMEPTEMISFLHSLPQSLLSNICASTLHTANGIHALMGVEAARRSHVISHYNIHRESGRVRVDFEPRPGDEVSFYLDESFSLIEERLQVLDELEEDIPF